MYPMTGSADTTRSPSSRTTSRRVPCVAGCCGPRFRIMSPVSSSTFTWASARWRNAPGSSWISGIGGFSVVLISPTPAERAPASTVLGSRVLLRGGVVAGHALDVDEAGPRLHLAREQGEVLAQRVAFELRREV